MHRISIGRLSNIKTVTLNSLKMCSLQLSTNNLDSVKPMVKPEDTVSVDDPPTTCCMSGCPNCVYIEWAEALTKQLGEIDPEVARKIIDNVGDPGMKVFLSMELKSRGYL